MRRSLLLAVASTALVCVPAAHAAEKIGQTLDPTSSCGVGVTYVQTGSPNGSYSAFSRGVITSWQVQADAGGGQLKLKIVRPAGGTNDYTTVGDSSIETLAPSTLNTFPTRIPISPTDTLGVTIASPMDCLGPGGFGFTWSALAADPPPGATATYSFGVSERLDVAAFFEPDADNDGFGDETQDACPTDPARQDDCAAPGATITKAPADKLKTKKKSVSVTFEFASDDPGATFNCALDGKQEFKPCTSPLTVSVKKGEHTFTVQATDAAGNASATVTDTFKVKRKKKKKK